MSKSKALNVLATSPVRRGGRPCRTCQLTNAKEINAVIAANAEMEEPRSILFLCTTLQTHLNYPLKSAALRNHIRNCLNVQA